MADGIVMLSGTPVGEYHIELDDRIIMVFNSQQSVKDTLEYASQNGMCLELLATPTDPDIGEEQTQEVDVTAFQR